VLSAYVSPVINGYSVQFGAVNLRRRRLRPCTSQ